MDKELKDVFRLNKASAIAEFCKAYAQKNASFAKQLKLHFLPQKNQSAEIYQSKIDKDFDQCFCHYVKKDRYQNWGPDLNWYAVGDELTKQIDKARLMLNKSLFDQVTYFIFSYLTKLAAHYDEDCAYEDQDLDPDDLGMYELHDLLRDVLASLKITPEDKLKIADRLEEMNQLPAFREHELWSFSDDVDRIRQGLLSSDDYIAVVKAELNRAENGDEYDSCLLKLLNFYIEKDFEVEIDCLAPQHLNVFRIAERYIDWLIIKTRLSDALLVINQANEGMSDSSLYRLILEKRKLAIYEQMGDENSIIKQCRLLFALERIGLPYYERMKQLIPASEWDAELDSLLPQSRDNGYIATGELAQIYYREKRYDSLFKYLDGAKNNLLTALTIYARVLTQKQQLVLLKKIVSVLRTFAELEMGRANYKQLKEKLQTLKSCCDLGAQLSADLVADFRVRYPRRRAMLEELNAL